MHLPKGLLQLLKNGRAPALFVGAGISKRAGIPIGAGVIQELKRQYPDKLKKEPCEYGYAEAFSIVLRGRKHRADRRRFFEELCAGKPPFEEHHLIAHLVNHKKFSIVFTTNFDHLTELALTYRCSPQPRVYLYDVEIEPPEYSTTSPKLLKLHGDFLFDDMANLDKELQLRLNENMRLKLHRYLEGRGLCVVGYGGNDRTIMEFLMQLVETPEGIRDGLWWVIHEETDRNNDYLLSLIDKMRSKGKRAEIVGPTDAVEFFSAVCSSLKLPLLRPIPFAIKRKRNLITSYIQRFPRPRQLPQLDVPRELDTNQQVVLEKLKQSLPRDGVIWLFGPERSGKSSLIGKLAKELDSRRLFYFSHRFAPKPASLSLRLDLEGFAGGLGIPVLSYETMLSSVFKRNAFIVFDDLFSQNPVMTVKSRLFRDILKIVEIREHVGRGGVILITSSKPTQEALLRVDSAIFHGGCKRGQPSIKRAMRLSTSSTPATRKPRYGLPLSVLSLIQFAEYPDVLARLCARRNIPTMLRRLIKDGLMETRGGRYVLRDRIQTSFIRANKGAEKHRLALAKRFETLSADQPFFRRLHYALESERHYRKAGYRREALLRFLSVGQIFTEWENEEDVRSTFRYYVRVVSRSSILSTLETEQLLMLLQHYYRAAYQRLLTHEDRDFVRGAIRRTLSKRGKGYEYLLDASVRLFENDFDGSESFLREAERAFSETRYYKELAWVLFQLSVCAFEKAKNVFDEQKRNELIERGVSWAQAAESIYSREGDQAGIAKANDHVALRLLYIGRYEEVLDLEGHSLHFHASQEGFTSEKGVVYGNLCAARLWLGDISSAEGYFHESNLNYAHRDDWAGVLKNYFQLFASCLEIKRRQDRVLPLPSSVYRLIVQSASLRVSSTEEWPILQLAYEANRIWFEHNLRRMRFGSILIALTDFLRLSHLHLSCAMNLGSVEELEKLAKTLTDQSLVKIGRIISKAGRSALPKILHAVETELDGENFLMKRVLLWLQILEHELRPAG